MCRASSPGKKAELYPECSGEEERKEVEKAILQVGQKGMREKKMNTFESNSRLSAAVRLIDGGSWAVHGGWAFGKTLISFLISLLQIKVFKHECQITELCWIWEKVQ